MDTYFMSFKWVDPLISQYLKFSLACLAWLASVHEQNSSLIERSLKVEVAGLQAQLQEAGKRLAAAEAEVGRLRNEARAISGIKHELSVVKQLIKTT